MIGENISHYRMIEQLGRGGSVRRSYNFSDGELK